MTTEREAFEAFISAPPFEMPIERFDDRSAWPGSYTELEVDLAWQAWKAATAAERERDEAICAEFSQDAHARYRAGRREYDDGQCDAANALADKIRSGA